MNLEKILEKAFNSIRSQGAADLSAKNISKGDLGMETDVDKNQGTLKGNHYWYYLVHGRKPGKQPPIESILEWIKKKGIRGDISERSLAFLIARKIGNYGTDIYMGKRPAWSLPIIIERNMNRAEDEIDKEVVKEIDKVVMKSLNRVFQDLSTPRYSIKETDK